MNRQRLEHISFALSFFQCALDWSGWSSWLSVGAVGQSVGAVGQSINCEQTSLPLEDKYFFCCKVDCIPLIFVLMISVCISVFGFVQLTAAVKLISLQPYQSKYFSMKTANAYSFSAANRK